MQRTRFGRHGNRSGRRVQRSLRVESLEPRQMLHGGPADLTSLAAEAESAPMPDFALVDVNPSSATADQEVSPRDFLNQVSGWYFGSAL